MSPLRYITASLRQYRRVHLAVAAGVAVATAVITGALLVGDSVRGSLRDLVLERLGNIDTVLVAEQPFRAELANDLASSIEDKHAEIAPLLLIPGSVSATQDGRTQQATQLSIMGINEDFWKFGDAGLKINLSGDEAVITQAIADELHAKIGDEVLLRVAIPSNIPADSTLGEKADATTVRRLTVKAILNTGIARFSLQPSQLEPRNVFVPLSTLQRMLDIRGKANVIATNVPLLSKEGLGEDSDDAGTNSDSGLSTELDNSPSPSPSPEYWGGGLKPQLADFGLLVEEVSIGEPPANRYVQLSAERLVLSPYVVQLFEKLFGASKPQEVVTYLANTINLGDKKIPYSTVTGIDSTRELGPLRDEAGQPVVLADNEIALNDWAAERLNAKVGDAITLKYYEPETTHGELVERTTEPLTVKLIVPLKTSDGQPTAVADEHFTPELPGVTDERSISDWELPFKLVEKISQEDEDYWDEYRTTPKAFVSLDLAKKLWSTRWGTTSALRLPVTEEITAASVAKKLQENIDPEAVGMRWMPIKEQGLAASRGTTPFEGLFLGFSFFLMASAVMLISLLFRLGAESRAREVGILTAIGWSSKKLRRVWLAESAVVAILGAAIGAMAGIIYAATMIFGLNTWWVAATVTPFLKLHVNPVSLAIGFTVGVLVSLVTIAWSLRKLTRLEPRQLLAGDTTNPRDIAPLSQQPKRGWIPGVLILAAIGLGISALFAGLHDEAQAGAFFGSGALVLTALLMWLRGKLRQPSFTAPSSLSLFGLSMRNARRNPSRTILSVALAAVASFLIVALSAFRLAPTVGGTGGFDLIATSDLPVYFDLNSPDGRSELGFTTQDEKSLKGAVVASFRVRGGEDASCLNLYQTTQPRVVGVPQDFQTIGDEFAWASTQDSRGKSPWQLLDRKLDNNIVPVVLDKSTAAYSLHLTGVGARFTIRDAFDKTVTLEVVGLLAGSVLQGNVLMSEANFLKLFPDSAGRKLFLIRKGSTDVSTSQLASLLETRLVDQGFDAVSATTRLAEFMAVQNTYLSTFQSLGALGLLLGTVGLAIAQLRSVIERRGELALLRSTGFAPQRLSEMVLGENVSLLFAGLGCGCLAALVATLPHWIGQQVGIPWGTLGVLLAIVAMAGVVAGWLAVRAAIRTPLTAALRGE